MSTAVTADVAVVGAGPAGMAAGLAAADLGCRVILVNAGPAMGGQIYRAPASGVAASSPRAAAAGMPRRLRRAAAHPGIHHLPGTMVWHATAPDRAPGSLPGKPGLPDELGPPGRLGLTGTAGSTRKLGSAGKAGPARRPGPARPNLCCGWPTRPGGRRPRTRAPTCCGPARS